MLVGPLGNTEVAACTLQARQVPLAGWTAVSESSPGLELMPFAQTLGVELLAATADEVRGRLHWHERLCPAGGTMHGGALMALADSIAGLCAYLNLPDGSSGTTTVESKTNFLRAVTDRHVDAVSKPLHRGRTIVVVETDLLRADGQLAARVTQAQLVLSPAPR
jgi:1,4-dihydroxy-2-naphthoyl-CoA hydrolase